MESGWSHELSEWPNYSWDASSLAVQLAECHRKRGALSAELHALGLKERQTELLQARTSDVIGSSSIEGESLDQQQVRSSIARRLGLDVAGLPEPSHHVDGVVEVTMDASQNYGSPLTHDRLFGWHAALFPTGRSGPRKIITGAYRDDRQGPMQVVSGPIGQERVHFEAPSADRIPHEMNLFLSWFEEEHLDPIIKAAVAHLWFVTLHPFEDGNGRLGRAIMDMSLARADGSSLRCYSMSSQLLKKRKEYYASLGKASRGQLDVTEWVAWFITRLLDAINESDTALSTVRLKRAFWEQHKQAQLNERQVMILNRLFDGFEGKLQTAKYSKLAKCSNDTALRDLSDLVEKGILIRSEAGGRSTSYLLSEALIKRQPNPPTPSA